MDIDIKITPSMRRKVDDLSRWLSGGDRARMRQTTRTILDLLIDTAKTRQPEGRTKQVPSSLSDTARDRSASSPREDNAV